MNELSLPDKTAQSDGFAAAGVAVSFLMNADTNAEVVRTCEHLLPHS